MADISLNGNAGLRSGLSSNGAGGGTGGRSVEASLTLTSQFWVEVQGVTQAFFKECSGLQIATATEQIKEGGLNSYVHNLPTRATQSNVTLKRGIVISDDLYAWYSEVLRNKIVRRTVQINIYGNTGALGSGDPLVQWTLLDALPIKYVGPSFRADESAIAVDSVEFTFGELKRTQVG